MTRKKIVAGNWKMNFSSLDDARKLINEIRASEKNFGCEVVVIPSFIFLTDVAGQLKNSSIQLGAQNLNEHEGGAYTGEVSAAQLKGLDVDYAIIGHSERREYYHETNVLLKQKLAIAIKHGLKPVFCCGEPLEIRNNMGQEQYVKQQLQESLFGLSAEDILKVVIAYEPIWAIGTGLNATAAQAQEMHAFIRSLAAAKYTSEIAGQVRILYGGSCKPSNAGELFSCPDVDGGLIGGASLVAKDFLAIIEAAG